MVGDTLYDNISKENDVIVYKQVGGVQCNSLLIIYAAWVVLNRFKNAILKASNL
jgi:hypothetical protein